MTPGLVSLRREEGVNMTNQTGLVSDGRLSASFPKCAVKAQPESAVWQNTPRAAGRHLGRPMAHIP